MENAYSVSTIDARANGAESIRVQEMNTLDGAVQAAETEATRLCNLPDQGSENELSCRIERDGYRFLVWRSVDDLKDECLYVVEIEWQGTNGN